MSYSEARREHDRARESGAEALRDRVLAQLRAKKLDINGATTDQDLARRNGWNEALAEMERWLEGRK